MKPFHVDFSFFLSMLIRILDSAKTARLLREAKELLASHTNPDPYIRNYMPGGTLFMRNPAPPLEALFPDGIPEGMSRYDLLCTTFAPFNLIQTHFLSIHKKYYFIKLLRFIVLILPVPHPNCDPFRRRLNIDMSNVPPEQEYADDCFVDSINKTYWINK